MTRSKAAEWAKLAWRAAAVPGSFVLGDAAVAAWLWLALERYTDSAKPLWPSILGPAIAAPLLALAFGLHRFRPRGPILILARTLGFGAALAGLGARGWLPLTWHEALWLGAACAALSWLQRAVYFGAWESPPAQPWEALRWLAVGAAGMLVMAPFYHFGSIGSGDAHWYSIMLADFIAQLRAGVFPVWVGQSLYAFNGAVNPLRFGPGFQYFGGIVDILTARALEPVAVRNASLAVVSLLGAYSSYACLRPILKRTPWVACGLSMLWISGPGVWAPAISGDQYMTFMAVPFLPVTLHGCWRVWEKDDRWARLWIAVGLAGTWICHPPVALWMTVISAAIYVPAVLLRRSWRRELGVAAFMSAAFLVLGSLPFASVLTLDNQIKSTLSRDYIIGVVHRFFPGNFKPIDPRGLDLSHYQLGFALLGMLFASLLLMIRTRPRGAWAFLLAALLVPTFVVPVPWLTNALWMHAPQWFLNIENAWPTQRVMPVWSTLVVFLAAIVLASPMVAGRAWQRAAVLAAFLCCLAWSAGEAYKVIPRIHWATAAQTRSEFAPDNIQLTRYAYSSFSYSPAYFSHAYMEPWFENRLLDRHTLEPILENSDAAAPLPKAGAAQADDPRLVKSGLLTAENIPDSDTYFLTPKLVLDPGKRYAMRLDFVNPGIRGTLQLMHPSLFREFMLPDSGSGINRFESSPRSLAFGSDASNSHVIPMIVSAPGPVSPNALFIMFKRTTQKFPFARYWLYTYDRSRLPIDVESWIPYRARVEAKEPAYLETPRMWLRGWRARVNGHSTATLRSRENLVMVPVEPGTSHVVLEYRPPAVLSAAFWLGAAGWMALGAACLCQLVLWTGGSRLPFGWTRWKPREGGLVSTIAGLPSRSLSLAQRHRGWSVAAALCVILVAAASAVAWARHSQRQAYLDAVGPVQVDFIRPYYQFGYSQPLLATGRAGAGTVVFITILDNRHVRLGADAWGSLFTSEVVEMDYNQVQSLVVSDSALYPLDNPRVLALSPAERKQLRGELKVELNGRTLIQAPCYAFETTPAEIMAGESVFGSSADHKFLGDIVSVRRLPIPRRIALPANRHAHMRVRFPEGRIGATEPVLTVSRGADARLFAATYLDDDRLRLTYCGPDGVPLQSAEVSYSGNRRHNLDFSPGEAADGSHGFDVACYFDGTHVLGRNVTPSGIPPVLEPGLNSAKAPGVVARFTGPLMETTTVPDALHPGPAETLGPEHMIVTLPLGKTGRREPLLTTGRTGAGDFIYLIYEDEGHVRIGYDHWGGGGTVSEPIAADYRIPHEIWIAMGSLYPATSDEGFWRALDPDLRRNLKSRVSVVFDGVGAISSATATHPSTQAEVTLVENRIGGSSCDPNFAGTVEFAERAGPVPPPVVGPVAK